MIPYVQIALEQARPNIHSHIYNLRKKRARPNIQSEDKRISEDDQQEEIKLPFEER